MVPSSVSSGLLPLMLFFSSLTSFSKADVYSNPSACSATEMVALLQFKKGLDDPSGQLSSWVGGDCCKWSGVRCDNRTGHIVKLDLSYVESDTTQGWALGGEIGPSLLALKHLRYLNLSGNNFGGIPIPKFIGSLQKLRYLDLSSANFGGTIPHQLGNLSNLHYLDLSGITITLDNCEWVSHLSSLKYFALSEADLKDASTCMQVLNVLPSLTELRLSACDLRLHLLSLPHVNFSSLTSLDLSDSNNDSKIPDWVFNITGLEHLDLSGNKFQLGVIPAASKNLCKLRSLALVSTGLSTNLSEYEGFFTGCIKTTLRTLDLSTNGLQGHLPSWLGDLTNLRILLIYWNNLEGSIPSSLGRLSSLQELDLSINKLSGSIPDLIGGLSLLQTLDLSFNMLDGNIPSSVGMLASCQTLKLERNNLSGILTAEHFSNMAKLKYLDISQNSLVVLTVSPDWIPPFNLSYFLMDSCTVGPGFPTWLQTQAILQNIGLSNSKISDNLPRWIWNFSSKLEEIHLNDNEIRGELPKVINSNSLRTVDLSSNRFEGPLPHFYSTTLEDLLLPNNSFTGYIWRTDISKMTPALLSLHLSMNNLSGNIPLSLCELSAAEELDLSNNHLTGEIPVCLMKSFRILNLADNDLTGHIPSMVDSPCILQSLQLNNNNLSGFLPTFLRKCKDMVVLNLRQNKLVGNLPSWIGESMSSLQILILRSNFFSGNIPTNLPRHTSLQVLDLADNNMSGSIPKSFGNFTAMKLGNLTNMYIHSENNPWYIKDISLVMKGKEMDYSQHLGLVVSMDLSNNAFSGQIPKELGDLHGLVNLDLSGNLLNGGVPESIYRLRALESLDLSRNNLSGEIPQSMTTMTLLNHLNLSYNNFSGIIPTSTQFSTFDISSFIGNPNLCGPPLRSCPVPEQGSNPVKEDREAEDEDEFEMLWVYIGMVLGFVFGFWAVCGTLMVKSAWRYACFQLVDSTYDKLYVAVKVNSNRLARMMSK